MDFSYKTTVSQILDSYPQRNGGAVRFYRELIDVASSKCLGTQELSEEQAAAQRDRFVGFYGARELFLSEPLSIQRGHREVVVRASKANSLTCREHIYPHL
jgi:hypothetical protein